MKFWMALLLCSSNSVCMSQENVVIQRNTYSMMVDANLDIDSTGASNTDLIERFPLKSVADRFSENINVMIDSVSGRGS